MVTRCHSLSTDVTNAMVAERDTNFLWRLKPVVLLLAAADTSSVFIVASLSPHKDDGWRVSTPDELQLYSFLSCEQDPRDTVGDTGKPRVRFVTLKGCFPPSSVFSSSFCSHITQ